MKKVCTSSLTQINCGRRGKGESMKRYSPSTPNQGQNEGTQIDPIDPGTQLTACNTMLPATMAM